MAAITNFHGIEVHHPHSGKCSRSVVARVLRHAAGAFDVPANDHLRIAEAAHSTCGEKVLRMIDSNGKITGRLQAK